MEVKINELRIGNHKNLTLKVDTAMAQQPLFHVFV